MYDDDAARLTDMQSARGTSESGDLGMVVGDPLVARVKRDMPGVNVRGYPVQVRKHLTHTPHVVNLLVSDVISTPQA